MRTLKCLLVVIITVVLVLDVSAQAQSVVKQLRQGREQEKAGDLDAAIQTYEQITTNIEANQRQVSQAYYRMGMCYLRKEDKDKAKQQFEHLVTEFPRSLSAVANARRELRKIQRRERDTEPREDRRGVIGQRPKISEPISPTGPPTVVRTEPANFADNVTADLKEISVTFDQQMMNRNWSWTQLDRKTFPKMVGRPRYDRERKTCTLRVKLKPGTLYFVGINYNPLEGSPSARGETRLRRGFKSASGQAAKPYALVFATADVMGRSRPIPEEMVAKAKAINSATETDVEPPEPEPKTPDQELFHDQGFHMYKTGFASVEEHYVQFQSPKPDSYLKAVRIFGVRPAEAESTDPDFHILVCDANFTAIADFQFPLDRFERRFRDWVTLTITPTQIPSNFAVGLSHQEKALAVAFNPGKSGNSFFKQLGKKVRPYSRGDWLIRAVVSDSPDMPTDITKGPGGGQSIGGIWLGTLKTPTFEIRVLFKITSKPDDTLTATLDSPDQGARNIPADKVTFRNGKLHVEVKSIVGVFDGEMSEDGLTIEGQWKQAGQSMPLVLKRSDEALKPRLPQEHGDSDTVQELFHDSGKPHGAVGHALGHAVRFEAPTKDCYLKAVRIHGTFATTEKVSEGNFHIWLCDENLKPIAKFPFPYKLLPVSKSVAAENRDWVMLKVEPTKVPPKFFIICKEGEFIRREGLMITRDNETIDTNDIDKCHSFLANPHGKLDLPAHGNWLIRVIVDKSIDGEGSKPTQPRISEDVGPHEDWGHRYFGPDFKSKNALQLKITNVTDDAIEDVIIDRLSRTTSQNRSYIPELTWSRTGTTLNIMLSPMKDVSGLLKKIDFGTIVARKGRKVIIEAKSDWSDKDFRFGPDPDYIVRLKIIGATDSATEEVIKEKLEQMLGSGRFYLGWSKMQSTITADVAPVSDVQAFVKKIDFGTVTNIRGRRVEVKVGGTTR